MMASLLRTRPLLWSSDPAPSREPNFRTTELAFAWNFKLQDFLYQNKIVVTVLRIERQFWPAAPIARGPAQELNPTF